MKHADPPFKITPVILNEVTEIAELTGKISSTDRLSASPTLRRNNRIRTIYGSLAIEQNTLTLAQVTAVLNGRRVLAPPKDIAEVRNAYEIYEHLDSLDPYSADDLLTAHGVMMRGLTAEAGVFRSRPVGVVNQKGDILHFGTLPAYVPDLVDQLLNWTQNSDLPMLVKSCVFHYEFELIHPFLDGNGRIGRLWHTLLLSQWNPLFAWLPIESIIHDRQQAYYDAFNRSNDAGESTEFIIFMLSAVKSALAEAIETAAEPQNQPASQAEQRWEKVLARLKISGSIRNADICRLLGCSNTTATRLLGRWTAEGKLTRFRDGKLWAYKQK